MALDDLKKAAGELPAKAALSAAKKAAGRALEDAMMSDEERALRKAEEAALAKQKRTKLIAMGVVGLLLVLGVVGLVVSYWHWFLLAGLLGLGFSYARHRWRTRGEAKEPEVKKSVRIAEAPKVERAKARAAPPPSVPAEEKESVEDELAALKARLDK